MLYCNMMRPEMIIESERSLSENFELTAGGYEFTTAMLTVGDVKEVLE